MWEFAKANPGSLIIMVVAICMTSERIGFYCFKAYSRSRRSRNIVAQGWPPEHLDADGDPVTKDSN